MLDDLAVLHAEHVDDGRAEFVRGELEVVVKRDEVVLGDDALDADGELRVGGEGRREELLGGRRALGCCGLCWKYGPAT